MGKQRWRVRPIKIVPTTMTLTDGPPEGDDDRAATKEVFKLYYTKYFFIFFFCFCFSPTSFSPDGIPSSPPYSHAVRFSHTPTLANLLLIIIHMYLAPSSVYYINLTRVRLHTHQKLLH